MTASGSGSEEDGSILEIMAAVAVSGGGCSGRKKQRGLSFSCRSCGATDGRKAGKQAGENSSQGHGGNQQKKKKRLAMTDTKNVDESAIHERTAQMVQTGVPKKSMQRDTLSAPSK
jgi:ribosome-binding protein aMBF1 (putative translation factor)